MTSPRSEPLRITAADYFGLMAYLFVMHGGFPGDTPVVLEEYGKVRATGRRRPRLRAVKGSAGVTRKRISVRETGEAAA